jgi:hypothetical protein
VVIEYNGRICNAMAKDNLNFYTEPQKTLPAGLFMADG